MPDLYESSSFTDLVPSLTSRTRSTISSIFAMLGYDALTIPGIFLSLVPLSNSSSTSFLKYVLLENYISLKAIIQFKYCLFSTKKDNSTELSFSYI